MPNGEAQQHLFPDDFFSFFAEDEDLHEGDVVVGGLEEGVVEIEGVEQDGLGLVGELGVEGAW